MIVITPTREALLRVGGFEIRWYGLLYVVAFGIAWWLLPRLSQRRGVIMSPDQWLVILVSSMAGVLVGGRVGYALLYEPLFFADHPLKIFAIHEGGMAFHGGLLGVVIAVWLVCRYYHVSFLRIIDVVVIPAAIGLSLGRLGNFINGELVGTPTTLPWGVIFPGDDIARHPVQLYAALKNSGLAAWCTYYFFRSPKYRPGRTAALFLIGYGLLRFILGFVREPDGWQVAIGSITVTEGQLLTLPLFFAGIILWSVSRRAGRRIA